MEPIKAESITDRIFREWDNQKNSLLGYDSPLDLLDDRTSVHWQCLEHGHEFERYLAARVEFKKDCPYCSGFHLLQGFNDLETMSDTKLLQEWDKSKNGTKTPRDFLSTSHDFAYWKCIEHGHKWRAKIKNRFSGKGCAVCDGTKLLKGFNDLASMQDTSQLISEWHPTKNHGILPTDVTYNAHGMFWWQCLENDNHAWSSTINHRLQGRGCLICVAEKNKHDFRHSLWQNTGKNFIQTKIDIDISNTITEFSDSNVDVDFYNEELKLAILFDDEYTHRAKDRFGNYDETPVSNDSYISLNLILTGVTVIRIREHSIEGKAKLLPFARSPLFTYIGNPAVATKDYYFDIHYKSFGEDADSIDSVVEKIVSKKSKWFE